MKYLLLTTDFPPAKGGIQTLLGILAKGLAANNEVAVLAPDNAAAPDYDARQPFAVKRFRQGRSRWRALSAMFWAARALVSSSDVIICGHVAAAPVAWAWGFLSRKPYFVYVHALEITPRRYRLIFRYLLRHAAGILTGSRYAKRLTYTYCGIAGRYIDVIAPAVSPELIEPSSRRAIPNPKRPGEIAILSVGRLDSGERYKGHDVVIRAMPYILRRVPTCSFWIVGDGDDEARLRALASAEGVENSVKFWGKVDDVTPFYHSCDIFIMVSARVIEKGMEKGEGFGIVYLEAGLFSKPVVAGRAAGALDAVLDGETGILVDPKSPAEVAAVIISLLGNPRLAFSLGAAGRARVLRDHDAEAQTKQFESAISRRLRGGVTCVAS